QWWKARPTRRDAGVAPEQRWLFPGRIDRQATTVRYLSRYTHRVAISNRRLIAADHAGVAFRWKDYRIDGPGRWKTMRLHPHEFIRRFADDGDLRSSSLGVRATPCALHRRSAGRQRRRGDKAEKRGQRAAPSER